MKKVFAIILSMLVLGLALTACGKKEEAPVETLANDTAIVGTWMEDYWDSGYTFNADGTGKETLGKSKIHGCSPNWIVKKYRSKCYYAVGDALYCIDQKTGKNKKLAKGKWLEAAANASSKYIYAVIADSKSVSVKLIDSHTMKVKNTRSTALEKGFKLCQGLITKKYLYLAACNAKNTKASFYRMQAAGKGGIKKIGAVELKDKNLSLSGSYVINDKYAYYNVYDYSKEKNLYYKYMFANKKSSVISQNVYDKATGKLQRWN